MDNRIIPIPEPLLKEIYDYLAARSDKEAISLQMELDELLPIPDAEDALSDELAERARDATIALQASGFWT